MLTMLGRSRKVGLIWTKQQAYIREVPQLVHLTINNELISTTVDHPFYVQGQGFVNAGELKAGSEVVNADGETYSIENIRLELVENPVTVYNFQVEDFHTYHVGENGILVHNTCTDLGYGNKSGTVEKNHLNDAEYSQAQDIVKLKGGEFVGQETPSLPGIDGHLDGTPISLKATEGSSPYKVLKNAGVAETKAMNAGYSGVDLYVDAKNVPKMDLMDFATGGRLEDIASNGVIKNIYVQTSDGWVLID